VSFEVTKDFPNEQSAMVVNVWGDAKRGVRLVMTAVFLGVWNRVVVKMKKVSFGENGVRRIQELKSVTRQSFQ
jgi:hypothetical protein